MTTWVALLRGINVGGNTLIKMADLKACCERLGYQHVQTYINSGNIIFRANGTERQHEQAITEAIKADIGLELRIVVKSLDNFERILAQVPTDWHHATTLKCNVIFLRHEIDRPEIMNGLLLKPEIEQVIYAPGALLWSAETSNLTKSAMLKLNASPLYKNMTVRIFNTVNKIHRLMLATEKL